MKRFPFTLLAAIVLAAGTACDDGTGPGGSRGTLTARAYIDRDLSGTFTSADSALSGVQLSVLPAGGGNAVATGATDATGVATFASLAPGSYRVEITGGGPTGAALTTNPTPAAAISFQGEAAAVEFRYAFFPGVVSGVVFRDENGNSTFDAGTDTPGAGLQVFLRSDVSGAPGDTIATTITDAGGAYSFPRVAPGSYFLEFERAGTVDYGASGATRPVTVAPLATQTVSPTFTGSVILPIAQARAKTSGQPVAVRGNITVPPNVFTSGSGGVNSEIWVQDATGGIAVFSVLSNRTDLPLGQTVLVTGTIGAFNGQEQIAGGAALSVAPEAGTATVAPKVVTGAEVNALGANEGLLVTVTGFTVTTVPGGTGAAFNVTGTTPDGQTIQVRVGGANTGLTRASFVVGNRYTVTGVLTEFTSGGTTTAQIKPRFAADVQGPTSIAAARALPAGTQVTVAGTLTVAPGSFTSGSGGVNSEVWVQDATGGIAVFSVPTANPEGLALGDRVEVTGTLGAFSGQLQLQSNPTVTKLAAGAPVTPATVTGAQVNALGALEGTLVTLPDFTVTTVPGGTGASFNVTGTSADGQTITVRVGGAGTGLTRAEFTVGSTYTITGVLTQFTSGGTTTAQIKPRQRSDVVP